MSCKHKNVTWRLAINEDGWECLDCAKKLGFNPQLDRDETFAKVMSICMDLHEQDFIYFSNSDHGTGRAAGVTAMCQERNRYDQYSIIQFVFESESRHGDYWADKAKQRMDAVETGTKQPKSCPGQIGLF